MPGQPYSRGIVAQIEQAALVATQNPLRVVFRQPCPGSDPFRFKPD